MRELPAKRRGGRMSFVIMVRKPYVCLSFSGRSEDAASSNAPSSNSPPNGPDCTRRAISGQTLVLTTCTLLMATETQEQHDALSSLKTAIGTLNRTKGTTSVAPTKAAFTSAGVLLTMIRVSFLPVHVGRLLTNVYRTRWPTKRTMSNWG